MHFEPCDNDFCEFQPSDRSAMYHSSGFERRRSEEKLQL